MIGTLVPYYYSFNLGTESTTMHNMMFPCHVKASLRINPWVCVPKTNNLHVSTKASSLAVPRPNHHATEHRQCRAPPPRDAWEGHAHMSEKSREVHLE